MRCATPGIAVSSWTGPHPRSRDGRLLVLDEPRAQGDSLRLLGFGDLDRAEALQRAVHEENLHRYVRLYVGLAEER